MPWDLITRSLGLGEGGYVRSGLDALLGLVGLDAGALRTPAHQRVAFTIAFVALAAKMAKADGRVSPVEAETFERLFEVDLAEIGNVRRVFDLAAEDSAGYESYAHQIARLLAGEPRLLRDVFDGLFHIAAADGIMHPREDEFLRTVAGIFGIAPAEFRSIRAAFVRDALRGTAGHDDSPYDILGVDQGMSDAAIRSRYLELVRDHHPDSLAARGVPAEFHAAAGRKLAVVNAAYDELVKQRGTRALRRESQDR